MRVATILTEMGGVIFRETSNSDTGIEGYIEEVNDYQEATGRLLAIQIYCCPIKSKRPVKSV